MAEITPDFKALAEDRTDLIEILKNGELVESWLKLRRQLVCEWCKAPFDAKDKLFHSWCRSDCEIEERTALEAENASLKAQLAEAERWTPDQIQQFKLDEVNLLNQRILELQAQLAAKERESSNRAIHEKEGK